MVFSKLFSKKEGSSSAKELKKSALLESFASSHKGIWDYKDFVQLLSILKKKGYEVDEDTLMTLLEKERQNYMNQILDKEFKLEEKTKPDIISVPQPLKIKEAIKKPIEKDAELRKIIDELSRERKALVLEIDSLGKKKLELNKQLMSTKYGLVGEKKKVEEDKVKLERVEHEINFIKRNLENKEEIYTKLLNKMKLREKYLDSRDKHLSILDNELIIREKKLSIEEGRLKNLERDFIKEKQKLSKEVFQIEKKKHVLYTEVKELEHLRDKIDEEISNKKEELVERFRQSVEAEKNLEIRKMEQDTKGTELRMKESILIKKAKELENRERLINIHNRELTKLIEQPERYRDEDVRMIVKELDLREEEIGEREQFLEKKAIEVEEKIKELNKKTLVHYASQLKTKGVDKDHIKARLIDAGWDIRHIKEHFK